MTCINKNACIIRKNGKRNIYPKNLFFHKVKYNGNIVNNYNNAHLIVSEAQIEELKLIYKKLGVEHINRHFNLPNIQKNFIEQDFIKNSNCFSDFDSDKYLKTFIIIIPAQKNSAGEVNIHSCVLFFTQEKNSINNNVWYLDEICSIWQAHG